MNYGELLKSAFAIARRNRYLWFFGFFAAGGASFNFPTGSGGENDPVSQSLGSLDQGVIVGLVVLAVLLLLVVIGLFVISQGALVESVAAIDRGGERRFRTSWQAGRRTFGRVLLWVVLVVVIGLAIVLLVGVPLGAIVFGVFSATQALAARIAVVAVVVLLALAALILIFVPFSIVWSLSLRTLVVHDERPVASLRHGYRMFRAHLGPSVLVWLIQLGIAIGIAIVLFVVFLVVGLVVAIPAIALFSADLTAGGIAVIVVAALVVIPLVVVLIGALGTFTHSIWTLAYLRLRRLETPRPA